MSPPCSSRLCSFTQCCLYIISPLCVSPSLCLHYWAGLMLSDVWLVPSLSPLIWQLCLAPDIIEEAGHYPAPQCPHIIVITPLPQYWSPPSHIQGSLHCSSSQGQQTADIRFLLRGERGRRHFDDDKLVSFCQRCRVLAGFIMFNAPPSPPDRCREPAAIISSRSCGFMFLSVSRGHYLALMSDPW